MNSGIFGKDSKIDDKAKRDAVPGVMSQRANAAPAAMPVPTPAATPTAAPVAAHAPQSQAASGSTLTVGPNIKLKSAEISDCDTLVVEGHVDGTVSSQAIQIAQTGTLNGTATIDNAEIRGEFKGELTVRKRLMICATGKVSGKIAYGKLVIEEGGELVGEIQAMHGTIPVPGNHVDASGARSANNAPVAMGLPARH
ncbi:MAG: polymer-forming cytoskeletal protein [Casimicrobiaceae bacterium]